METVTIRKAKAELSRLIQRACRARRLLSLAGRSRWCAWSRFRTRRGTANLEPGQGKVSYTPDAFAPLTDRELKDLGFE